MKHETHMDHTIPVVTLGRQLRQAIDATKAFDDIWREPYTTQEVFHNDTPPWRTTPSLA